MDAKCQDVSDFMELKIYQELGSSPYDLFEKIAENINVCLVLGKSSNMIFKSGKKQSSFQNRSASSSTKYFMLLKAFLMSSSGVSSKLANLPGVAIMKCG